MLLAFTFASAFAFGFLRWNVAALSCRRRRGTGGRLVHVDVFVRTIGASAAFPSFENSPAWGGVVVSAVVAVFANAVTMVPTWAFALFAVRRLATNSGICNLFYPSQCS